MDYIYTQIIVNVNPVGPPSPQADPRNSDEERDCLPGFVCHVESPPKPLVFTVRIPLEIYIFTIWSVRMLERLPVVPE